MNDSITLDRYVVDTLMRDLVLHDRSPSSYLVYLAILGMSDGRRVAASHRELAELTGLSKRAVQDAVRRLAARQLLKVERRGRTEAALLTVLAPWRQARPFREPGG